MSVVNIDGENSRPEIGSLIEIDEQLTGQLIVLSVRNANSLTDCSGLGICDNLWSLDLTGCALSSVEPLVELGALGELRVPRARPPPTPPRARPTHP